MHSTVIQKIDILEMCSEIEVNFIVNNLKTTLHLPNDVIVRQGEEGDSLYFINRGTVEIYINKFENKVDTNLRSHRDSQRDPSDAAPANPDTSPNANEPVVSNETQPQGDKSSMIRKSGTM